MLDNEVSFPHFSTIHLIEPSTNIVPAKTLSLIDFDSGIDSPVNADASTCPYPS
jgi:hypothetical protein